MRHLVVAAILIFCTSPALAFEDREFSYSDEWPFPAGGDFAMARAELDYAVEDQTATIYVPDDAEGPMGIYVHLNANDSATRAGVWEPVLDAQNMAYCSPDNAGGSQHLLRRFFRAVDCVASLDASYEIDLERVVIGGYSAGGVSALDIVVAWQELFVGGISHARTVPWEPEPIATIPGSRFASELERHDTPALLASLRERGRRFAFVSGEEDILPTPQGDFSNYEGILKAVHQFWERGIPTRVFDVPGMAHRTANAESFEAALLYVLECRDDGRLRQ